MQAPPEPPRLADAFGLGRPRGALRPLNDERRSSAAWALDTDNGRFIVKRVRWGDPPDWWFAQTEGAMRLERRAVEAGLSVPLPIEPTADGFGYVAFLDDVPYRVHERLDGRSLAADDDVADWVGRTLASLHELGGPANPDPQWYGLHPEEDWNEWIDQGGRQDHPWHTAARIALPALMDTTRLASEAFAAPDDVVLSHRDVNPWNVIVTPDGPHLTDFDSAGPDSAWLEANSTALEFAFLGRDEPDPGVARRVLHAYLEAGGRPGSHRGALAAGRWAGSRLMWIAWNMWRSLGHRPVTSTELEDADRIVAEELEGLPGFLELLDGWGRLLEGTADET